MEKTRYLELPDGGIQLANDEITVVVYPRYGGKIASFKSGQGNREWFWHNENLTLQPVPFAAPYDDNFYGGMDELFPNDLPGEWNGQPLPDHGELWSQEWNGKLVEEKSGWGVQLSLTLRNVPVKVERAVFLTRNGMTVENTLTNLSDDTLPYIWAIHPAFQIGPQFRLHLPEGKVMVESEINGRVSIHSPTFLWPGREIGLDLSIIPERNGTLESYYITDIAEGNFVLEDVAAREALQIRFPRDIFPHMWLFMPLGGWRDHYVAVIEPSSTYPCDLNAAIKQGTHSVLRGHTSTKALLTFTAISTKERGT
jgi:hypothetical protein